MAVALRKESVDRNLVGCINRAVNIVALRKESVDRNFSSCSSLASSTLSLSARRAWIEIANRPGSADTDNRRSPQGERG